jgi:lincosamide nucleotidyltransferase A/C/D/E
MVSGLYGARVNAPAERPPLTGKGRQPSTAMDAGHGLLVLDALRSRGIGAWVHGGWGIDALLGAQSREHDDLDLVVQVSDWPRISVALARLGYRVAKGAPPMNTVLLDSAGRQIDLHPVRFAANGDGIYRMETGQDWPFPAPGFAGQGRLLDRAVRCLTPEVEVLCHSDYELEDVDYRDLAALHDRFGVEVPVRP